MNEFNQLQAQHERMLANLETLSTGDVLAYIEGVRPAGAKIPLPRERDQLRANLRYWASFIYDRTHQYPNTELAPAESVAPSIRDFFTGDRLRLFAVIFIILIALVSLSSLYIGLTTDQPVAEVTRLVEPTVDLTATSLANTRLSLSPTPISVTMLPPPTETPTPTPVSQGPVEPVESESLAEVALISELALRRGGVSGLAFSPDSDGLASGGEGGAVRLWDTLLGSHEGQVQALAFAPDGSLLATGGNDGLIRLWAVSGRQGYGVLRGHEGFVFGVAFSPAGQLASSGGDGRILIWDVANGRIAGSFDTAGVAEQLAFLDEKRLAYRTAEGVLRVLEVDSGQVVCDTSGTVAEVVLSYVYSPGRDTFFIGDTTGQISEVDATTCGAIDRPFSTDHPITALAIHPSGDILAVGNEDGAVWLVSLISRATVNLRNHDSSILALAFSGDGRLIASGDAAGRLLVWGITDN